MQSENDEELMNLYIQGDMQAFDVLYSRHKAKVYGYLVKRLPSKELADEVFQSAFLKLHHARDKYQFGEPFLPWLFAIIKNTLFDHLRKIQSETRKLDAYEMKSEIQTSHEGSQNLEKLEDGLSQLTKVERDLMHKRYVEGLDFEEIAQKSNSSAVAVRQAVSRVTRKLKSLVKGSS